MNDSLARFSPRALFALALTLSAGPASAFNVSGFEFPDPDRSLARRPADAGRGVSYDDVVTSYNHARDAVVSTQRSLSAVELLGQTLTAEARALFEQIPPDRRTSYEQAMASALESYTQIRAKNQDLVARLARVSEVLRALQSQILKAKGGEIRLRSEIAALRKTAEELRAEAQRIAAELPAVTDSEEFARNLSLELDRELAALRNEYWTEIGQYFKDRNLGTPVDYASPLQPLPAQTERRIKVHDERSTMTAPVAAVASTPTGAVPVIVNWGYAFPAPAWGSATTGSGNEAKFSGVLAKWNQAQQENERLSAKASGALIKSEQARYELKRHVEAELAAEHDRNVVVDAVGRLRTEVGWKVWELEQKTNRARELLSRCVDKAVEKGRWQALRIILKKSLKNPVSANSMYAHLHLAGEVLNKDLSRAPDIILHSDDPSMQAGVQDLMSSTEKRGMDFINDVAGTKLQSRAAQQMVEKLLVPEEPKKD